MGIYNNLTVRVYANTTTPLTGWGAAEGISFGTYYPGGFADATFSVVWDVTKAHPIASGMRVKFYNGLQCVYEGRLTRREYTSAGFSFTVIGYFGDILDKRSLRKPWADTRIDDGVWAYDTATNGAEKVTVDRQNRIRFTPKHEAFYTGEFGSVVYTAPVGQTIKYVAFTATLAEGAQAWELGLDDTVSVSYWTLSSSATGPLAITLSPPSRVVRFYFQAKANQTPLSDGTIYGEVSGVVVCTETGAITLTEIAKDVCGYVPELSSYIGLIMGNALSVAPFISDPPLTYAGILAQAAKFGDTSNLPWASAVWESDLGTDDKPVLVVEQQPDLAGCDYSIRLSPQDASKFAQDISGVVNWVAYSYTSATGKQVYVTPDDDASLMDADSIAAYGQREPVPWLSINTSDPAVALTYAKTYLAKHKDPAWTASGDIQVVGAIKAFGGNLVPVSQVRAGKRIRIENFLNDLNGTGLTLSITATRYDDATETVSITTGVPDQLSVQIARLESRIF